MDSPLILLVFWFVINLLIKSSKDKKKIEEARRNKSQQIENRPLQNQSTQKNTNRGRNIVDVLKEEIEKEVQREKEMQRAKQIRPNVMEAKITTSNTVKPKVVNREPMVLDVFQENKTIDTPIIEVDKPIPNSLKLDIKNDLLKGFIYSEILSKPKSIRNSKRSM